MRDLENIVTFGFWLKVWVIKISTNNEIRRTVAFFSRCTSIYKGETIICQTIIRPNSFCYNMSDRFLGAVISSQTGCYNKSDTFYANNLLIYCAVIYQTTGNYLILPVVICQTNSVIICQTKDDSRPGYEIVWVFLQIWNQ